jgi:hypothetical protein
MTTLQARVADELAAAARRRADNQGMSLSRYVAELVQQDLARAEEEAFWQEFTDYFADESHVAEAQAEAELYAATLTDGLDQDESWDVGR